MGISIFFQNFFKRIFFFIFPSNQEQLLLEDKSYQEKDVIEELLEQHKQLEQEDKDKMMLSKRTLTTKLYALKQKIKIFKNDFPEEYQNFLNQINDLEKEYEESLVETNSKMTFEIDPELDNDKIVKVDRLDKSITSFIDYRVKLKILTRKLQTLAVKLNILYNVSIFHRKVEEQEKIQCQIQKAREHLREIAQDIKVSTYIFTDNQAKDMLITLISYNDYLIFRICLMTQNKTPEEILDECTLNIEFYNFDYKSAFISYVEDELSNLEELLVDVKELKYKTILDKDLSQIYKSISLSNDKDFTINDASFWNQITDFEIKVLSILKSKEDNEKYKLRILDKMDIDISSEDVLSAPRTNAYLELTNAYFMTQEDRLFLLIKLFDNLNSEITYKDIYFLLLLFDSMSIVENSCKTLYKNLEKYREKYSYNCNDIYKKKELVLEKYAGQNYIKAFDVGDEEEKIEKTLSKLRMDYKITDGYALINSFYFNGFDNICKCLEVYETATEVDGGNLL